MTSGTIKDFRFITYLNNGYLQTEITLINSESGKRLKSIFNLTEYQFNQLKIGKEIRWEEHAIKLGNK